MPPRASIDKSSRDRYMFLSAACPENAMVDCTYPGCLGKVTHMFNTGLPKIVTFYIDIQIVFVEVGKQ